MEKTKQNYVKSGSSYTPVGGLREVTDTIEANIYKIVVPAIGGPFLSIVDNIDMSSPSTIYGRIPSQVEKAFNAYDRRDRNTGVLLSGERGMGKTLFIRLAIRKALEKKIPVIVLGKTEHLDETISTINSITQPLLVVMDEFEKNFCASEKCENDSQVPFLTMLDGLGAEDKRMFIASVNSSIKLNDFMLNRPGRFYYHFEFKALSDDEMIEYLTHETNNIDEQTIRYAVSIMQNYPINYDGLSAIAAELNAGMKIEDTLRDLNLDRAGTSSVICTCRINGYEYSGTFNASISEIRRRNDVCIDMYSTQFNRHGENTETSSSYGYLGHSLTLYLHNPVITCDSHARICIDIDASFDSIYTNETVENKLYDETSGTEQKRIDTLYRRHIDKITNIELTPHRYNKTPLYLDV